MIDIRNTTRRSSPRIPFGRIAQDILPKEYSLSLVVCGDVLSRNINRSYRPLADKKNYSPNVLSFPIGKNEGEIFLNIRKAEREAKQFGMSAQKRIAHLFVHACFHLVGMKHGDTMERRERKVLRRFGYYI